MIAKTRHIRALPGVGLGLILLGVSGPAAKADSLAGLTNMTADANGAMLTLTYQGTTYTPSSLTLGTTTRWWVDSGGNPVLWDPANALTAPPQSPPPVANTSNPKSGDIGAKADNFFLTVSGVSDLSSIDGINFQQTLFPSLASTFFIFERGGNDAGNMQGILDGGPLRSAVNFTNAANGGPFGNTLVSAAGQNAFGMVFTTDVPVRGVRINASGYDTLIIAALVPEPSVIALAGIGGLAFWFARRKRC